MIDYDWSISYGLKLTILIVDKLLHLHDIGKGRFKIDENKKLFCKSEYLAQLIYLKNHK